MRFPFRDILGVMFLLPALGVAAPQPAWALPQFQRRAVFTFPRDTGAAVVLSLPPGSLTDAQPALVAYGPGEKLLPCRPLLAGREVRAVLIATTSRLKNQECTVYFGPAALQLPGAVQNDLQDPEPIFADVRRCAGKSMPNSWPKLAYLFAGATRAVDLSHRAQFGELGIFDDDTTVRTYTHTSARHWIVRLRTTILCPADGPYRFAVDGPAVTFLLVDGVLRVSRLPFTDPAGPWRAGDAFTLAPGVHQLEVYTYGSQQFSARVGWQLPGTNEIVPLPRAALLAGCAVADTRIERKDRVLHPDFTADLLPAYSFRSAPQLFVPVSLKNTTKDWVSDSLRCRWSFPGPLQADGDAVVHTFTGNGRQRTLLEVFDELGFAASIEREVDCRQVQPVTYPLDGTVLALPPVCFPGERAAPILRVAGRLPTYASVTAEWDIVDRRQAKTSGSRAVTLGTAPLLIPLGEYDLGTLRQLNWRLLNVGTAVRSGSVHFQTAPFAEIATRADGDRLYAADGSQLVLLPAQTTTAGMLAVPLPKTLHRLVCYDDLQGTDKSAAPGPGITGFDQVLGNILEPQERVAVHRLSPPAWEQEPGAYGSLLKLTACHALPESKPDAVIVSLGREDLLRTTLAAEYERQLAALADQIAGTWKIPLILVTPPPYPDHTEAARTYAAALRRTAAARGLPVADLFTAFIGLREPGAHEFFQADRLSLSQAGHNLAAQLIARALMTPREGR